MLQGSLALDLLIQQFEAPHVHYQDWTLLLVKACLFLACWHAQLKAHHLLASPKPMATSCKCSAGGNASHFMAC